MSSEKILVLGGVKSGKSRLAENLAGSLGIPVTYVATARAKDAEMSARIAVHRSRRPPHWRLLEEPLRLAKAIRKAAHPDGAILVDCLTLWLTNLLMDMDETLLSTERTALLDAVREAPGTVVMVSNETNMGVMPLGELTRRFCDEAGTLHQELASLCDRVVLTVAGLPHVLKGDLL